MKKVGGVYVMPCEVNGLPLRFIFDTGASEITISLTEALFMLKNGYLDENDLQGSQYYKIANGDLAEGTEVLIREVKIGELKLYNVKASIVHELDAPLLLGQSALSRLGKIEIDYSKNTLTVVKESPDQDSSVPVSHLYVTSLYYPNFELPLYHPVLEYTKQYYPDIEEEVLWKKLMSDPDKYIIAIERIQKEFYTDRTPEEISLAINEKYGNPFDNHKKMFAGTSKRGLNGSLYLEKPSLRKAPDPESQILYKCPRSAEIFVIEKSTRNFYRVSVNGYRGYINKYWLKRR